MSDITLFVSVAFLAGMYFGVAVCEVMLWWAKRR